MDDACGLLMRLIHEIDPALADLERGGMSEEEAGVSMSEMLRLRHEAGDQFGAYGIGILQMPRDARRYQTCDSGKARFSWADTYTVAERINWSKARVNKIVLTSVLTLDISRHMDELRMALEAGHLSPEEVLPCVVSLLDGVERYELHLSADKWGTGDALDKVRANSERMCYTEVSIHLRPK